MADDPLFLQLVLVFQESAWQAMGKLQNPQSGKTEVNLPLASHAIDMLGMLEAKTKGNLADAERQLLSNALTQLRLNYVEAVAEQKRPEAETKPDSGGSSGTSTATG